MIPGGSSRYWWFRTRNAEMDQGVSVERQLHVKQGEKRLELRDIKTDRLVRPLEGSAGKATAAISLDDLRVVKQLLARVGADGLKGAIDLLSR